MALFFDDKAFFALVKNECEMTSKDLLKTIGTFYFDNFPEVLFSHRARPPVPNAMHYASLLQRALASNQIKSNIYFVGGRLEPPAPTGSGATVWFDALP